MTREKIEAWLDRQCRCLAEYKAEAAVIEDEKFVLTDLAAKYTEGVHLREDDFNKVVDVIHPDVTRMKDECGIHTEIAYFIHNGVKVFAIIEGV